MVKPERPEVNSSLGPVITLRDPVSDQMRTVTRGETWIRRFVKVGSLERWQVAEP